MKLEPIYVQNKGYQEDIELLIAIVNDQRYKGKCTKQQISTDITGCFDNFYLPFLNYYEENVSAIIIKINNSPTIQLNHDMIIANALRAMKRRLLQVVIKTLITEIHEKKRLGQLAGGCSSTRYGAYNDSFLSSTALVNLLTKYPVMAYQIYNTLRESLGFISQVLDRLNSDFDQVSTKFNLGDSRIDQIAFGQGDSHNKGQSVLIFTLANGQKFVYKPREIVPEAKFESVMHWLNQKGELKAKIRSAAIVDCKTHGWQEFIEYKPCQDKEQVELFFYRIGVLLGVCYVFKTTDIHYENLIACGEHPIIVDLETLFSNDSPHPHDEDLLIIVLKELNDSVLGTMLLPQKYAHSEYILDISGIAGDAGSRSKNITVNTLINTGSDDIRFAKGSYVSREHSNRVVWGNTKVNPLEFCQEIDAGFTDCYQMMLRHGFGDQITAIATENIKYRQVVRPTHVYEKFIEAGSHPKYLKSFKEREDLISVIHREEPLSKVKAMAEINDLLGNDVPYFRADFATRNLYTSSGQTIPEYFKQSLAEILMDRINNMGSKDLQKQLSYIRMSLLTTKKDLFQDGKLPDNRPTTTQSPGSKRQADEFLGYARDIGDYLAESAIYDNNDMCTWFTLANSDEQNYKISPITFPLYEGGGVVLFLAFLGAETGDEKYTALAKSALSAIEFLYHPDKPLEELPISPFWGLGSQVYLYYTLAVLWKDDLLYQKYKDYLQKLLDYKALDLEKFDFLGGLAGVITLCLNIYGEERDKTLLRVAKKYGKALYKAIKTLDGDYLTGLSHGYAGLSLALIYLGKVTGSGKYLVLGKEMLAKENSHYDASQNNWLDLRGQDGSSLTFWCHGASGIGLARAKLLQVLAKDEQDLVGDIKRAAEKTLSDGFKQNSGFSLCHGQFGNLDIMLELSQILQDQGMEADTYCRAQEVVSAAFTGGIESHLQDTYQSLNFMLGLSGSGYALLRLVNRNLPSVLSLDVIKKDGVVSPSKGS